jgi:ABC-type glutathione transport system ATPase component
VTLAVERGETLAVVGESGSGKIDYQIATLQRRLSGCKQ